MKAGRELDALVAEKVMGWVWRRSRSTGRRCIYAPGDVPEHMVQLADGSEPLVNDWHSLPFPPRYSTDISAAWEVVGKFRDVDIHKFDADPYGSGDDDLMRGWHVVIMDDMVPYTAEADTAPLAICLAALEAVK